MSEQLISQQPSPEDEDISLLDMFIVLAKHKKLVIGLPMLVGLVAAVVSMLLPHIYTGTAKVLPPQQNQASTSALLNQLGALSGIINTGLKNPLDLYVGMLKSRTVADALIDRFKLLELYDTNFREDARKTLVARTVIASGRDGIISVSFEDRDPKRAAAIANGYVEELDRLTQTLAVTEASQRRLFFEKQLKAARGNLGDAEMALKSTQEATGIIKLDDQGKAIIESVARLRAEVAAREVQLAAMRTYATDRNPEYLLVQQQIAGLKAQLAKFEKTNVAGDGDIFVATGKVPEAGLEYLRRFRDVKYYETLFEVLAKQYELARIDEAKEGAVIQFLDKAVEPERRTRPKRTMIVIVSVLAAGVVAVVWAFMAEGLARSREKPNTQERMNRLRRYLAWP